MFDSLGSLMFGHSSSQQFRLQLRCFSAPFFERADSKKINDVNHGGKILLPPSALDLLVRYNISYPMMFKLTNVKNPEHETHCGVLEFLAEEGRCYLPSWIMRQLQLKEGDCVIVKYVSLPQASYAKFKPQSTDFLSISNPRAVLEVELRKFACLTKGDIIAVNYNEQLLEFLVLDVRPGNAVNIIECDMNVEFDAPEGYVEENSISSSNKNLNNVLQNDCGIAIQNNTGSFAFPGNGYRLDGKTKSSQNSSFADLESMENSLPPLIVETEYKPGKLTFMRYDYKNRSFMEKELNGSDSKKNGVIPFQGSGRTIRSAK